MVGHPATPLIESRARFCLSASHNKQFLDKVTAANPHSSDFFIHVPPFNCSVSLSNRIYSVTRLTTFPFFLQALDIINEVGDLLRLKNSSMPVPDFSETDDHFLLR